MTLPPVPERPSVAVSGTSERLPIGRILCIGRNYAAHSVEMGGDGREQPFHFLKTAWSLLPGDPHAVLPFPPATDELHHEVELVVALGRGGRDLGVADALDHVFGYAVGLDLTRRDRQREAKAAGRPWATAKDFDGAAVCGALTPATVCGHPDHGAIRCSVGQVLRQEGDLSHMTWKVPEILAHLSALMTLRAGDLIYTGTPAGVGPLQPGDHVTATIAGLCPLQVEVTSP